MFNTLQELLAQTKGWEYSIAIVFIFLFITFCWLLGGDRKKRKKR